MVGKLNAVAFGYAGAVWSAFLMAVLGIFGNLGIYTDAVEMMKQWHIFFSLSISGIVLGMVEATIIGFVLTYVFAWLYNKFV